MLSEKLQYKVGFLGCPSMADVEWNQKNLCWLKNLGFNTIQLNIAWGCRPSDEPLNLEDVLLAEERQHEYVQVVPLRSDRSYARIQQRREDLKNRIKLCRELGLRTLFHFGAPYNAHVSYGDSPPNCLLDDQTQPMYIHFLERFVAEFPGVDDLQVYTYDQDAWLCSEFGDCPRCLGVPLHKRVVPFINALAEVWKIKNPQGRLWWEPWELSAGQVLKSIEGLNSESVGLMLHSNVAEVQATMPVDRWLKNVCNLAGDKKVPVIVEHWLGGPSEELEPYVFLSHPQITFRALKEIISLPNICGIKEYYGMIPKEDPNLKMTGLFFVNPDISEQQALMNIAESYGSVSNEIIKFWHLCSEAMELFPWDLSWFIREIGRATPVHSMSAARLRGQQCHTPSWESSRHSIFMKCDDRQPDPWMLEDIQLRCELAAEKMKMALNCGNLIFQQIPTVIQGTFTNNLKELYEFLRRALSYAYHIRETNLATCMRRCDVNGLDIPQFMIKEMCDVLKADQENQGCEEPMKSAIVLLEKDVSSFLSRYFHPEEDKCSKGIFSVTSS